MKTYFISGHRNITFEEFTEHYIPLIDKAMTKDCLFVVGDCPGVDLLAQAYIGIEKKSPNIVTVFHMCENPRCYVGGLKRRGGYTSDFTRDYAMTVHSDEDIAWVRFDKKRSGTQMNLNRRKWMNERIANNEPVNIDSLMELEANNHM